MCIRDRCCLPLIVSFSQFLFSLFSLSLAFLLESIINIWIFSFNNKHNHTSELPTEKKARQKENGQKEEFYNSITGIFNSADRPLLVSTQPLYLLGCFSLSAVQFHT